jgi:hypothetical protein
LRPLWLGEIWETILLLFLEQGSGKEALSFVGKSSAPNKLFLSEIDSWERKSFFLEMNPGRLSRTRRQQACEELHTGLAISGRLWRKCFRAYAGSHGWRPKCEAGFQVCRSSTWYHESKILEPLPRMGISFVSMVKHLCTIKGT